MSDNKERTFFKALSDAVLDMDDVSVEDIAHRVVKEKIDPELIAGIKIIINDSKQFDASMQSKLQKIII